MWWLEAYFTLRIPIPREPANACRPPKATSSVFFHPHTRKLPWTLSQKANTLWTIIEPYDFLRNDNSFRTLKFQRIELNFSNAIRQLFNASFLFRKTQSFLLAYFSTVISRFTRILDINVKRGKNKDNRSGDISPFFERFCKRSGYESVEKYKSIECLSNIDNWRSIDRKHFSVSLYYNLNYLWEKKSEKYVSNMFSLSVSLSCIFHFNIKIIDHSAYLSKILKSSIKKLSIPLRSTLHSIFYPI